MPRYKDPMMQWAYGYVLEHPPIHLENGVRYRRMEPGHYFPFWWGYDRVGDQIPSAKGAPDSIHRAVYMAGVRYRTLERMGRKLSLSDVKKVRR